MLCIGFVDFVKLIDIGLLLKRFVRNENVLLKELFLGWRFFEVLYLDCVNGIDVLDWISVLLYKVLFWEFFGVRLFIL